MKILIAGGGIAGLTAALCIARQGFNVELFEQSGGFEEVGAGLQVSPNGARILYRLGLRDALESYAFHPASLDLRLGQSGTSIFSIPLRERCLEAYTAPYLHLHRADLINVLLDALSDEPLARLHLSSGITGYETSRHSVELHLENAMTQSGDILIGADGIHSAIRRQMHGDDAARFTGNVAWRATLPATEELRRLIPPAATVWTGPRRHAVTYYLRGGELINFVGVVEQSDWTSESWTEEGDTKRLQSEFSAFALPVQALLQHVTACFRWALHDRPPLPHWIDGRVALMGDAAHPMLPFMAQGAVMAMEDAATLSALLARSPQDPISALNTYQKTRLPRATRVQAASRANMQTFHKSTITGKLFAYGPMWLANRAFPYLVRHKQDWLYSYDTENAI